MITYACNDTNDKMFLLSYKEATTYFTSSSERLAEGSDYAKCQGLWVSHWVFEFGNYDGNSCWWLRSPHINNYAYFVQYDGVLKNTMVRVVEGVRPVCWIIL